METKTDATADMIAVQVESSQSELAVDEKINSGRSAILRVEPRSVFGPLGQYIRTAFYSNRLPNHLFSFQLLLFRI